MKRAALAVAHRILVIAYFVIRDHEVYIERNNLIESLRSDKVARRLTRRLQKIGYTVTLARAELPVVSLPRGPIATPEECRKCARWGIPCLHAWQKTLGQTTTPTPANPTV